MATSMHNRVTLRMNFDEKVWKLMERIPKGRVTTYGQIARKLNTKAYRVVGNACRKNPYAPRVQCSSLARRTVMSFIFLSNLRR